MNYTVLLFDADETLFDFEASEKEAFKQTMLGYGFPYQEAYHLEEYKKINAVIWQELEEGHITQKELKIERFRRLSDKLQVAFDAGEFAKRYMKHLSQASFLYEHSAALIKQLSKCYTLAIITNGLTDVQNGRVKQSIIGQYFEQIIISEEVGFSKPDPRIFELALTRMQVNDKSKVLMIGDSLTSDIQGGIHSGIDTCWFNSNKLANTSSCLPTYEIEDIMDLLDILA